jgi:hypothetical protein
MYMRAGEYLQLSAFCYPLSIHVNAVSKNHYPHMQRAVLEYAIIISFIYEYIFIHI